jgi:hypothetical protein
MVPLRMPTVVPVNDAPPPPPATPERQGRLDVIVAVHGIGAPNRCETLASVVNRCFGRERRPEAVPIGFLRSQLEEGKPFAELPDLPGLAFTEVWWTDLVKEHGDASCEDVVAWSATIVERLKLHDLRSKRPRDEEDYAVIRRVLRDIARSIALLRYANLTLTKIHVGSARLERLLGGIVAEVQLFAEFDHVRKAVVARFRHVIREIDDAAEVIERERGVKVNLHVVAHSLGSVVALLGLLDAANARDVQPRWLGRVRSLMTLGSPLETVLLLWPRVFDPYARDPHAAPHGLDVPWHDYTDVADPIAGTLSATRAWIERHARGLFLSGSPFQHEFGRYPLPLRSHIDYWLDQALFDHWLDCLVRQRDPCSPPPGDAVLARLSSFSFPFALTIACALVVAHSLGAWIDLTFQSGGPHFKLLQVTALGALVFGTVAVGGAFRISKKGRAVLPGLLALAIGAFAVEASLPAPLGLRLVGAATVLASLGILSDWIGERRGFRRTFNFIVLLVVALAGFGATTWQLGAEAIVERALHLGLAVLFWLLTILFFDFAIVQALFARTSAHLAALARHWDLPSDPRPKKN